MFMRRLVALLLVLFPVLVLAQANGKLQLHFIDVGQGDAALLISPQGETVLFDNGNYKECGKPVAYLDQLGVTDIDYHVASHYHSDHIGCTRDVFATYPLQTAAYDRGGMYESTSYTKYVTAVTGKRQTATRGTAFTLDSAATPVTITILALNGNGIDTDNENDRSVVAKVSMGSFDAVIGGDLSGVETDDYLDIESGLAPDVGEVEVYKVHHHGSRYSSNEAWLAALRPRVGIISAGAANSYGHPTEDCLLRLHNAGITTYWTSRGKGAEPIAGVDHVAGTVIVEYAPGAAAFTVTGTRVGMPVTSFPTWEPATVTWVWSHASRAHVYHDPSCLWATQINPKNRKEGSQPPGGWRLHTGCPTIQ
jgi:beta-lactamase superfamily II metal-dependent hydrolase